MNCSAVIPTKILSCPVVLTHNCVALFPHERDVEGVGKVSHSRFDHVNWSETSKGLVASFASPLTVSLVCYLLEALFTHAGWIEKTVWVLNLRNVTIDEENVTLIGIVLLSDERTDLTNQIEIAGFFNRILTKQ